MKSFDTQSSLKRGWELFKKQKAVLILITLIFVIVGSISNFDMGEKNNIDLGFFPLLLIIGVLIYGAQLFIQMGWLKTLLMVEDGNMVNVKDIFKYGNLFWKYAGTTILYMVIVTVGFILLIIPGFYFFLKYLFAPLIIIDKNVTIREAFDQSKLLTQDIKWKLFWMLVLLGLVNLLGILALFVGILVTLPVTSIALFHIYRTISKETTFATTSENTVTTENPVVAS